MNTPYLWNDVEEEDKPTIFEWFSTFNYLASTYLEDNPKDESNTSQNTSPTAT
eukprot:Pgem_evm1s7392